MQNCRQIWSCKYGPRANMLLGQRPAPAPSANLHRRKNALTAPSAARRRRTSPMPTRGRGGSVSFATTIFGRRRGARRTAIDLAYPSSPPSVAGTAPTDTAPTPTDTAPPTDTASQSSTTCDADAVAPPTRCRRRGARCSIPRTRTRRRALPAWRRPIRRPRRRRRPIRRRRRRPIRRRRTK